ncbi:MAG TPA: carboxypeptidase-like regulatory domain-containing protein [Candidatus Acidoferrum sp.]|nr:carboxypeptidase-like regulatory domain-containing protein [Candidatus Acidoferrum sp.]
MARCLIRYAFVCFVGLAICQEAHGQAFALTGGSSSLFDAHGGSVEMRTPDYTGRFDLGYMNGPSLGFSLLHLYHGALLDAGDQEIPLVFPTDIFDRSYYFYGRGLSVLKKSQDTRLYVFVGTTSTAYWAPFLNVARSGSFATAIFYERQISPSLRWFSRNLFASRQTSIQSVEWAARKDIKMALSGGVGNNQAYEASSFSWSDPRISVDASYTLAGNKFQRVEVSAPQLTESDRENIRVEYAPIQQVRIVASRNNYLAPPEAGLATRAAVNGFGIWTGFSGTQLYGSLYQSSTSSFGKSEAYALGAHRDFTRRLGAGVDYLGTRASGRGSHSIVGNIRETFSSRLSVNQVITHGNGQTGIAFGGNFISNFATLSVDYQTVYLPFVQAGPNQLKQVVVVSLHFQLPHGVQFDAATNVTPLGQLRYTAYASTYAYRGLGPASPGTSFSGAFFRNAVHGQVLDPQGEPIEGAALRIGADLAVTDSGGNFIVRLKKAGDLNLRVAFDEFTAPGNYVVAQAPATVRAASEESAQAYLIVLRRLPNTASPTDSPK